MERNIISFSANQQELIKTGGISHYASNVVGYIVAEFDLGENWTEFDSVRAVFKSDYETVPAVLSHGACVIPFEVLKRRSTVKVNLVGSVAESNVLVDRLTSYPITALVVDANATVDNDIEPITPTEFEQFVAAVKADADRAEAGAESAEAAVEDAEASEQAALGSAQAAAASALNAANSASDASNYADRVAQMVAEVIAEIEEFEGVTVTVETLPAGSQATASFADGVLHLGIPRGDKGEQGDRGERGETGATGATGATGNGIESITLTSTSGAVKTYTILFTDGTSTTFEVTDGEVTQAVLDETVSDLKADLNELEYEEISKPITPKYNKSLSGDTLVLNDAEVNNLSMSQVNGIIYPTNLWRYFQTSANADMSSYNTHFTVEVENGGYKITKDTFNTGSRFTKNFIKVPLDGYIYLSCDAHTTHPTALCRINIALNSDINKSLAEDSRGTGHLQVGAYVHAGDEVVVKCFSGASDEYENTWYYENIMLSYSPYSEYEPFSPTTSNYSNVIDMAEETGAAVTASSTAIYGGYKVDYALNISSPFLPTNNNWTAFDFEIITNEPNTLKLGSFNEVYAAQENNIIGISSAGKVSIYHDGVGATAMKSWLKTIGLKIRYVPTSGTYTGTEKAHTFRTGNAIKYSSSSSISYNTSTPPKRKVLCFGDSITGMFDDGGGYVGALNYINRDVDFINCGFSGCQWTDHSNALYLPFSMNRLADAIVSNDFSLQDASGKVDPENSNYNKLFANHLSNIKNTDFTQVDFVTIFYGVNDFGSSKLVNSADDSSAENKQRTNVEDAVKYTIEQLLTAYPQITILLVCPYWTYILGSDSNTTPNSIGKYLFNYCSVIESVANAHNMCSINLYNNLGVTLQNRSGFLLDNAHPNYKLSKMIANRINTIVGDYR